ncbi:unnamed protein product, partial [Symbiodinium necroappetens]
MPPRQIEVNDGSNGDQVGYEAAPPNSRPSLAEQIGSVVPSPLPEAPPPPQDGKTEEARGVDEVQGDAMNVVLKGIAQLQGLVSEMSTSPKQSEKPESVKPGVSNLPELPTPGAESCLLFSDWIHNSRPPLSDISDTSEELWEGVLNEASTWYAKYLQLDPLSRLVFQPEPSEFLNKPKWSRVSRRIETMILAALPATVRQEVGKLHAQLLSELEMIGCKKGNDCNFEHSWSAIPFEDRKGRCKTCGAKGHKAQECKAGMKEGEAKAKGKGGMKGSPKAAVEAISVVPTPPPPPAADSQQQIKSMLADAALILQQAMPQREGAVTGEGATPGVPIASPPKAPSSGVAQGTPVTLASLSAQLDSLRAMTREYEAKMMRFEEERVKVEAVALLDSGATHPVVPFSGDMSGLQKVPVTLAGESKDQALSLIAELEDKRLQLFKSDVQELESRMELVSAPLDPTEALRRYAVSGKRPAALRALISQPYLGYFKEETVGMIAEELIGLDEDSGKRMMKQLPLNRAKRRALLSSESWAVHLCSGKPQEENPFRRWAEERQIQLLEVDLLAKGGKGWDLTVQGGVWRVLLWAAATGRIVSIFSSPHPKVTETKPALGLQPMFLWSLASVAKGKGIPYVFEAPKRLEQEYQKFSTWSGGATSHLDQAVFGDVYAKPTQVFTNINLVYASELPTRAAAKGEGSLEKDPDQSDVDQGGIVGYVWREQASESSIGVLLIRKCLRYRSTSLDRSQGMSMVEMAASKDAGVEDLFGDVSQKEPTLQEEPIETPGRNLIEDCAEYEPSEPGEPLDDEMRVRFGFGDEGDALGREGSCQAVEAEDFESMLAPRSPPKDPEELESLIKDLKTPVDQIVLRYFIPLRSKTGQDVMEGLQKMILDINKRYPVKILHSDPGTEFSSYALSRWAASQGIRVQHTLPTDKKGNGLAERIVGWIKSRVRTLLKAASLPIHWWPLAARWAAQAHNRSIEGQSALPSFGHHVLHRTKTPKDAERQILGRWVKYRYAAPHSSIPEGHVLITESGNLVASKGFKDKVIDPLEHDELKLPELEAIDDVLRDADSFESGGAPLKRLRSKTAVRFVETTLGESAEEYSRECILTEDYSNTAFHQLMNLLMSEEGGTQDRRGDLRDKLVFGAYCHGGKRGVTKLTYRRPFTTQFLNQVLFRGLGREGYNPDPKWSSLMLMRSGDVPVHRDYRNEWGSKNHVLCIPGGLLLWTDEAFDHSKRAKVVKEPDWNSSSVTAVIGNTVSFDPRAPHAVRKQPEWLLVGYTPLGTRKLSGESRDYLSARGFDLPDGHEESVQVAMVKGCDDIGYPGDEVPEEGDQIPQPASPTSIDLEQDLQPDSSTTLVGWDFSRGDPADFPLDALDGGFSAGIRCLYPEYFRTALLTQIGKEEGYEVGVWEDEWVPFEELGSTKGAFRIGAERVMKVDDEFFTPNVEGLDSCFKGRGVTCEDRVYGKVWLVQSSVESNLWKMITSDNVTVGFVIIYVDDMMFLSTKEQADLAYTWIKARWECTPLEQATEQNPITFLGVEIHLETLETGEQGFALCQKAYIEELARSYGLTLSNRSSPVPREWVREMPELEEQPDDNTVRKAQKVTGEVLWVAQRSRPDVAHCVGLMASWITK